MTNAESFGRAGDFIDAEYVIVRSDGGDAWARDPLAGAGGMDMLRDRVFARARDPQRAGPLFWVAGVALAAAAFWISGGHAAFTEAHLALAGRPASHMRIAGWNSKVDESGVNPTLMIDGEVVNDGARAAMVPALEIEVASANGTRTRYKLGTGDASVDAQGTFPFSGRLHLPKDGVKTVSVSFVQ